MAHNHLEQILFVLTMACTFIAIGRYMFPSARFQQRHPRGIFMDMLDREYMIAHRACQDEFLKVNPWCSSCESFHKLDRSPWRPCFQRGEVARMAADIAGARDVPPRPKVAMKELAYLYSGGFQPGEHGIIPAYGPAPEPKTHVLAAVRTVDPTDPGLFVEEPVGVTVYPALAELDDDRNRATQEHYAIQRAHKKEINFARFEDDPGYDPNDDGGDDDWPELNSPAYALGAANDFVVTAEIAWEDIACYRQDTCVMDSKCPNFSNCEESLVPQDKRDSAWLAQRKLELQLACLQDEEEGQAWLTSSIARLDAMADKVLSSERA